MRKELEKLGFEYEFSGWFLYFGNGNGIKICIDIEDVYLYSEEENTQSFAFKFDLNKVKKLIKLCK